MNTEQILQEQSLTEKKSGAAKLHYVHGLTKRNGLSPRSQFIRNGRHNSNKSSFVKVQMFRSCRDSTVGSQWRLLLNHRVVLTGVSIILSALFLSVREG